MELANISRASQSLAAAETIEDVVKISSFAKGAADIMKRQRMALDSVQFAQQLYLDACRKAGGMLAAMKERGELSNSPNSGNTLLPLGVNKMQSSRWQRIASVPEDDYRKHVEQCVKSGSEITQAGVMRLAKQKSAAAAVEHDSLTSERFGDLPANYFGCIYADPPWRYGNQGTRGSTDNHYPTMTVDDIASMDVKRLAADDCFLHLWTTNAFLFDARRVLDAWGFEYKSCFVWVKPQIGMGNYWRVSHEFLLLGIKGRPQWKLRNLSSWMEHKRTRHSQKPEAVRTKIEAACDGPYLEMFGRQAVNGWTVFGNQVAEGLFCG